MSIFVEFGRNYPITIKFFNCNPTCFEFIYKSSYITSIIRLDILMAAELFRCASWLTLPKSINVNEIK